MDKRISDFIGIDFKTFTNDMVRDDLIKRLDGIKGLIKEAGSLYLADEQAKKALVQTAEILQRLLVISAVIQNDLAFVTASYEHMKNDAIKSFHSLKEIHDELIDIYESMEAKHEETAK